MMVLGGRGGGWTNSVQHHVTYTVVRALQIHYLYPSLKNQGVTDDLNVLIKKQLYLDILFNAQSTTKWTSPPIPDLLTEASRIED